MMSNKFREFLLEHNRTQSEIYCSPDAKTSRRLYRKRHPTKMAALKCMDGRINLPVICRVPPGIFQPFRNIAGEFDLGWPYFGSVFNDWVQYALEDKSQCLPFVTYHWSEGNNAHRGCAGFKYDKPASMRYTVWMKEKIEKVYGKHHYLVHPIRLGIETDTEGLVFHGEESGLTLDLTKESGLTLTDIRDNLLLLYPSMNEVMVSDLVPVIDGNQIHVALRRQKAIAPERFEHCEQGIGIGSGFAWLHLINMMFIIGPYSYDIAKPAVTAAEITLNNIRAGRVNGNDGVVLMSSAGYRHKSQSTGVEMELATEKAHSMSNYCYGVIKDRVPEIVPMLDCLVGTTDLDTLLFTENVPD